MRKIIEETFKIIKKYSIDYEIEIADTKHINDFLTWIKENYSDFDCDEIVEFYRTTNGIEFNGTMLYSINKSHLENIYSNNHIWHENDGFDNILFLGEYDISWYCYNFDDRKYYELDKPSGEIERDFESFKELLEFSLKRAIQ